MSDFRHNTTARDLTDAERVKDATHELRRCADDAGYAAWARKWGEPAIAALGLQSDRDAEIEAANDEATEAEEALGRARNRCDEASTKLEAVLDLIEEGKRDAASAAICEVQNLLGEAA